MPDADTALQRYFEPRRVARMAVLVALSAVGALIKLPGPTGTVALDSAPGFVAGASFGLVEGSIVGALGHLISAMTAGFPLGLPVHLLVAVLMASCVAVFGWLARNVHLIPAVVAGVLINGVGGAALMIPIGGAGLFAALVLPLLVGAIVNIVIAAAGARGLDAAGLSTGRTARRSRATTG